jgi:hypothetical protein
VLDLACATPRSGTGRERVTGAQTLHRRASHRRSRSKIDYYLGAGRGIVNLVAPCSRSWRTPAQLGPKKSLPAAFPPSLSRDKNRRDTGKSQSTWTDSNMETPGSLGGDGVGEDVVVVHVDERRPLMVTTHPESHPPHELIPPGATPQPPRCSWVAHDWLSRCHTIGYHGATRWLSTMAHD